MPPKEFDANKSFEDLRRNGNETVDALMKVLKDAKVVGDKASEEAARKIMKANKDGKVTLENFKEAVNKSAASQVSTVTDSFKGAIAAAAAAVKAAAEALEEAMKK